MKLTGMIRKKWNDVLIFDNSTENFVEWQWYRNGVSISGATSQFYKSPSPLSGIYHVVVKNKEGNKMETCPFEVVASNSREKMIATPNPSRQGTNFSLVGNYSSEDLIGAKIMITDLTGKVFNEINKVTPDMKIKTPGTANVYIVNLILSNGKIESVKLLVN